MVLDRPVEPAHVFRTPACFEKRAAYTPLFIHLNRTPIVLLEPEHLSQGDTSHSCIAESAFT